MCKQNNTFFVGQLANQMRAASPVAEYVAWAKKWPDEPFIRHLSFGNSEALLVNSISAHRQVLQTKCYSFGKPAFFERLVGDIVGKGLMFSVGDEHRTQRRQLSGAIHAYSKVTVLPEELG
jgi:cytochrome P450